MKRRIVTVLMALGLISGSAFAAKKTSKDSLRVYRFENLKIEGQAKNPALMYFLKRIRKQFRSSTFASPDFTQKIIDTKNADFLK